MTNTTVPVTAIINEISEVVYSDWAKGFSFTFGGCAYIAVPVNHPWYSLHYDDLVMFQNVYVCSYSAKLGTFFKLRNDFVNTDGSIREFWVFGLGVFEVADHDTLWFYHEDLIAKAKKALR